MFFLTDIIFKTQWWLVTGKWKIQSSVIFERINLIQHFWSKKNQIVSYNIKNQHSHSNISFVSHISLLVVSSPLFIAATISKLISISASTVSVISDVTIQSVDVTSVPICKYVCRHPCRSSFINRQSCYFVQLIYVNCMYTVMFVI